MNTITIGMGQQSDILKLNTNKFTLYMANNMYYIFSCCNNIFCIPNEEKYIELFNNIKIECDYYSVMKFLDNNIFFLLKDNETNEILWGKNITDTISYENIKTYGFYLERLTKDEQNYFVNRNDAIGLGAAITNKGRMIIDLDYYFYWKLKYEEDIFKINDEDFE